MNKFLTGLLMGLVAGSLYGCSDLPSDSCPESPYGLAETEQTSQETEHSGVSDPDESEPYIRAVTYFGDAWPANFWNNAGENLEGDMDLIREDGFNAMILAVPWNEFMPAGTEGDGNRHAFFLLERILNEAGERRISVYIRLGYAWDFYDDSVSPGSERMERVLYDEPLQNEWLRFAEKIRDAVSGKEAFRGIFLCWEDFWSLAVPSGSTDSLSERVKRSRDCGLSEYILRHYTRDQAARLAGGEDVSDGRIPFPTAQDPLMAVVYAYYDELLCRLLEKTRQVFPELTMEVRSDLDPVILENGRVSCYEHTALYERANPGYVCAMYGIYQGFDDSGEILDASRALELTSETLRTLRKKLGGTPLFVEQFNYYDNTPGYAGHARLDEGQIGDYLGRVGDILKETSSGYGLWTWRDYKTDVIFNGQFTLGCHGWTRYSGPALSQSLTTGMKRLTYEEAVFCIREREKDRERQPEDPSGNGLLLKKGETLTQIIPSRRKLLEGDAWILELEIETQSPADVLIRTGDKTCQIGQACTGTYQLLTDRYESVEISADRDIRVRRVRLWNHLQSQMIRQSDLEAGEHLAQIRDLNRKLAGEG